MCGHYSPSVLLNTLELEARSGMTRFRQYKEYMNIPSKLFSSDELRHCNAWKLFLDLLKGHFNYRLIFNSNMAMERSGLNLLKGLKCHDAFTAKKRQNNFQCF